MNGLDSKHCISQHPSRFLAPGWTERLADEFSKEYMRNLSQFLQNEYRSGRIVFPPKEKIFRALRALDYDDVKVVILGQDPYHGPGQANGFCFAVSDGVKAPPSLVNIFKEIESDLGLSLSRNTTLESLVEQGVLLLNTVLTVRASEAFSHRNRGWEILTHRIVEELNRREKPMVFLLWGSAAQAKASLITNRNHLILCAPHPSPLSSYRGFFGCKHFSKANEFLSRFTTPIDWSQA